MALEQVQVGNIPSQSLSDTAQPPQLGGKAGEGVIAELHGKYYTQNYRGNVYQAATAVGGLAFSIFSNTTFIGIVLWNSSLTKNLVPIRCTISVPLVTAATAATQFGYCFATGAGTAVATGAFFSAVTTSTPIRYNCSTLAGGAGIQGSSLATVGLGATLTNAFTWGREAALTWYAGVTNTAVGTVGMFEDFDGSIIIPPGGVMALTTSVLSGSSAAAAINWYESPT